MVPLPGWFAVSHSHAVHKCQATRLVRCRIRSTQVTEQRLHDSSSSNGYILSRHSRQAVQPLILAAAAAAAPAGRLAGVVQHAPQQEAGTMCNACSCYHHLP
jgi:hypothetical protein